MVHSDRPAAETVFLVSGGAKGITAQCVIALARRFRSKFILVGRSQFDAQPEAEWAVGKASEADLMQGGMAHLKSIGERPAPRVLRSMVRQVLSRREISTTLHAVDEAGGEATYIATDVTNLDDLRAAVAAAEPRFGAVTGILHGAGVLADKLVQDKTVSDFDRVVSVKVDGLLNLLACVPAEQLDMLVLFSSVAGFYGNVGQVDYAVANEILNKAAHWVRRQAPHCRVLAMDWGPWDGGMVTPALREQLAARNVEVIPIDVGTTLLADLLSDSLPGFDATTNQVVVGGAMVPPPGTVDPVGPAQSYRIRRRLTLEANPFLRDHVIGGSAVLPTVCAISWMINACEQLSPGYQFLRMDDYRALKGIVFDGDLADAYILELEAHRDADGDGMAYDALISSQTRQGRPRYHYRARITVGPPLAAAFASVPVAGANAMDGATLYRDSILFHGPRLQGIESILELNEGGLTMRCCQPWLSREMQGQFPVQTFNPYAVDVQLQSLLVWAHRYVGHAGLPLQIRGGVSYQPIRFGAVTYTTMQVRSCTARSLVADVTTVDETGRLCLEVRGAEITL
ncbi:MAG: SDR family NAD(P)-dependent oxidoreductase, partial [Anaerolineae bacterium]|nr:SDR family NAD(P)-dependent oxidoreductase [Anaerolineae bacterium]